MKRAALAIVMLLPVAVGSERLRVEVRTEAPNTPVVVEVPGAAWVKVAGVKRTYFANGRAAWVAPQAGLHRWEVRYGKGRPRFRDYQEPVGIGDAFHYNRPGGFDPLGVGMSSERAAAVDWDGDGRVDILQRNLYSHAFGEPYWGIYFWRNIGTNARPKFDHYVRLRAGGAVLSDVYNTFQAVDWDGDGRPDLLYGIGGGRRRGAVRVYFNRGGEDLEPGPEVKIGPGGDVDGMRLIGGDLFTLRSRVEYFPEQVVENAWFRHRREGHGFGPGEAVRLAGQTAYEAQPNGFYDADGDGRPEPVGMTGDLRGNPPRACAVYWPEEGRGTPRCIPGVEALPGAMPIPTEGGAFGGLLVSYMGGWLRDRFGQLLRARGQACSSGGYSSVEVADWEGDGDLDFVVGNELGYVQLIENVSRGGRTMFASPRVLVRVARWQFFDDADPEKNLGQAKPTCVDWDGDGDLDLLVGNNANRVAHFENTGTRARPRLGPMQVIRHDGGECFGFRKRPAAVDWNGDGLLDLVAGSAGERNRVDPKGEETVCVFLRYRDRDGRLRLHQGTPLRMENGSVLRLPVPYRHGFEVADWERRGQLDLFTNEQGYLYRYRNRGAGLRKEMLKLFGKPIRFSHHETSVKVVDWDADGRRDVIAGGEAGWIYFFRRAALEASELPRVEVRGR
jgi:hypothetical protein